MLTIVIRKMLKKRWMFAVLLVAAVLSVAVLSSIPTYTNGILQRLLRRDLEAIQRKGRDYPGKCFLEADFGFTDPEAILPSYTAIHRAVSERFVPALGLPILSHTQQLTVGGFYYLRQDLSLGHSGIQVAKLEALSDFEDHIQLLHGRMYAKEKVEGVYEVIVSERAMSENDLLLGKVYLFSDSISAWKELFRVRVVGIFRPKASGDPFWFQSHSRYTESFLMDHALLVREFVETSHPSFHYSRWSYALDYYAIDLKNLKHINDLIKEYTATARKAKVRWVIPFAPVLEEYLGRARVLRTTLWFLQAPLLIMLGLFVFLVSRDIVENEGDELAVFRSRGSSSTQLLIVHLLEGLLLGGAACIVGPPLGFLLCTVMGSANGFLELVQRTALRLSLSWEAYLYALIGVFLFVAAMVLPAILTIRTTVVLEKQRKRRAAGRSLWKRFFVDLALVAVSLYGLYSYHRQQRVLQITGVEGSELPLDPLLFVASVLFILGAGLLFLRLFPVVVKLVFWVGKRLWSPAAFAAFLHLGRSSAERHMLMLFLILSVSLGIYSSITARTINTNRVEKVLYAHGADLVLIPEWGSGAAQNSFAPGPATESAEASVFHREPDFRTYSEIEGIARATKVFKRTGASLMTPGGSAAVQVMAVVPAEFGKVAWFDTRLLPNHWFLYLNVLARSQKAFLLSRSLRDRYELKRGDRLYLSWGGQGYIDGYVAAFIDYWPSFNPYELRSAGKPLNLVVANLDYIHAKMVVEPYQVWLKKDPGASSKTIFDDIEARKLRLIEIRDSSQSIIEQRNDPMLQGTNGSLTVNFVVILAMTFAAYIIHWIFSLKGRSFEIGILRAIGFPRQSVTLMLLAEQLFSAGFAIGLGVLVGSATSRLFVPVLQLLASTAGQVPPFHIVILRADLLVLYLVMGVMLLVGALVFQLITSRIRIYQAIKLGEE